MQETITSNTQPFNFAPAPTHDEPRTFCFFADNLVTAKLLLNILSPLLETTSMQAGGANGHGRHVRFTVAQEGLALAHLRWLFQQMADADHAVATLAPAKDYAALVFDINSPRFEVTMPGLELVERLSASTAKIGLSHMHVAEASLMMADRMQRAAAHAALNASPALPFPDMFRGLSLNDRMIADQDIEHLRHRRPYATVPGSESRTFRCRAEFQHDVKTLLTIIHWATESAWSSQEGPLDTEVKFTLRPDTLSIDEVRWLFGRIVDGHVPLQTLALESEYTGERSWLDAGEMGAKQPSTDALRASFNCLADGHDAMVWQLQSLEQTLSALG